MSGEAVTTASGSAKPAHGPASGGLHYPAGRRRAPGRQPLLRDILACPDGSLPHRRTSTPSSAPGCQQPTHDWCAAPAPGPWTASPPTGFRWPPCPRWPRIWGSLTVSDWLGITVSGSMPTITPWTPSPWGGGSMSPWRAASPGDCSRVAAHPDDEPLRWVSHRLLPAGQ